VDFWNNVRDSKHKQVITGAQLIDSEARLPDDIAKCSQFQAPSAVKWHGNRSASIAGMNQHVMAADNPIHDEPGAP
jgi:hypothetical protein